MLRTDYKNDILDTDVNVTRVYNIKNSSGAIIEENVMIEETTVFSQQGTKFGANDINATNEEVNHLSDSLSKINNIKYGYITIIIPSVPSKGIASGTGYIDLTNIKIVAMTGVDVSGATNSFFGMGEINSTTGTVVGKIFNNTSSTQSNAKVTIFYSYVDK